MRSYLVLVAIIAVTAATLVYVARRPEADRSSVEPTESEPPIFVVYPEAWSEIDVSTIEEPTWVMVPPPAHRVAGDTAAVNELPETKYVGAATCAECHRETFDSFVQTSHYQTSSPCNVQTVKGSLDQGKNALSTRVPNFSIEMRRREDQVVQHVLLPGPKRQSIDFPMDLIFGSGKMAQTFAYWAGDQVCQSHASYFTETDEWVNSPLYIDGTADYSRPILPRCFECHFTHVQWVPNSFNRFVASSEIYGVTCERCHGPGKDHCNFHRSDPESGAVDPITNPRKLPRERQLDVCNLCHAGTGDPLTPAFSFQSGDVLAEHVTLNFEHQAVDGGVHTDNQAARLYASPCYMESSAMTCTTCHNPHVLQRGELRELSKNCMKCHEVDHCGFSSDVKIDLESDCINCHMPQRRDTNTEMTIGDNLRFPLLRDHFIRISPEATAEFLKKHSAASNE